MDVLDIIAKVFLWGICGTVSLLLICFGIYLVGRVGTLGAVHALRDKHKRGP